MRRLIISIFLIITALAELPALDITLNGRNLAVVDKEALASFARALDGENDSSALPLNALFPWLESLEYVEAQSGPNRIYWEADRISLQVWNEAMLIRRGGIWEIHLGRDVFSAPDRIVVHGVALDIETLCVWSVAELPNLQSMLETSLTFRKVTLDWRTVSEPSVLLEDPPSSGLPHLVIFDIISAPGLSDRLSPGHPVAYSSSSWFTTDTVDENGIYPSPLALDAYSPEAALLYILSTGANLFTVNGEGENEALSPALADWLSLAADGRKDGSFLITDTPLTALSSGDAASALSLPSSEEGFPYTSSEDVSLISMSEPSGMKILSIPWIVAMPLNLPDNKAMEADLLMAELSGTLTDKSAVVPELDSRLPLFYQAYQRIGRLAISGQMGVDEAVALMNEYVSGNE